jgi:hypothetical protein
VLTFAHSAASQLTQGVIAGVLHTDEAIASARACSARASASLCSSAFNGIAQQIEYAQDILDDGTNRPGVPCDAMSIGIGFSAALVANPDKVGTEPPPPPNPCDAGADASTDASADASTDAATDASTE